VIFVPLVAMGPFHAQLPLAVHAVALVLDQATVESPPETIDDGVKVIVAVGAPDPETVTVAEAGADVPPVPVQVSV
jgi:hypothetical protein